MRLKLRGIIPPMVTPFTETGSLDFEALKSEVRYNIGVGASGLVVGGSTGEGSTLTKDELSEACRVVKRTSKRLAGNSFPVLSGIITNSTGEAIEYATAAKAAGVDGLQVTPIPGYIFRPSIEDQVQAFKEIGDAINLPIVIYNVVPTNKLSAADLGRLSSVRQVVGVKQSGADIHTLADVILALGDKISVLSAVDDMLLPSLLMGAKGSISAANTVCPDLCVQLYDLYRRGRIKECLPLHWKILRMVRTTVFTSTSGTHGDVPARVHFAINAQGRRAGYPRRPFTGPTDQGKQEILEALRFAGKIP